MNVFAGRILLVKQSSLGDVVHALPVAHALKRNFPECSIGWIVERAMAPILDNDPAIDIVHPIHIPSTSSPGKTWSSYYAAFKATCNVLGELRSTFQARPYDVVLDLHRSFRSGLLAAMNPRGVRFGLVGARELNTFFQHRLIRNTRNVEHAVDKNLLFLRPFGCFAADADFFVSTSLADERGARQFMQQAGLEEGRSFVYVNPTARWESKYWYAERWSILCDQLQRGGIQVVFGGSKDDLPYLSKITGQMSQKPVLAAGALSLTEAIALMKHASAYVGVDTGPMHIAAMVGVPVVALFGPTHPERVGPYNVAHTVLRAENLSCLCCRKRTCEDHRCMKNIDVKRVYDAVMDFAHKG